VSIALASAVLGFGAIYVTLGGRDNDAAAVPGPRREAAQPKPAAAEAPKTAEADVHSKLSPLQTGTMTTFIFKKAPEPLGDVTFVDKDGRDRTLKDWRGRVVLLNLWATWCAPCRKEMPALDRLQKQLGSDQFEVVALAIDRAGKDAAAKFLDQVAAANLGLYVDATGRMSSPLKVVGLPTTILLDREGREVGRLTGPAEWDAPEAVTLIRAHLAETAKK
jgi:thiol-disulfide isomerase/thioredoxin